MNNFKVLIETDQPHTFKIDCENPETASMLALKEFLGLESEDGIGLGIPISQVRGSELSSLLGV